MTGGPKRRAAPRGGMVRLAMLPAPPGAPPRLRVAARRARIAAALGPELARQLADAREQRGTVELTFHGERWETRLEPLRGRIEAAIGRALRRPGVRVVIRSTAAMAEGRRGVAVEGHVNRPAGAGPDPVTAGEGASRLQRIAERLLARQRDGRTR